MTSSDSSNSTPSNLDQQTSDGSQQPQHIEDTNSKAKFDGPAIYLLKVLTGKQPDESKHVSNAHRKWREETEGEVGTSHKWNKLAASTILFSKASTTAGYLNAKVPEYKSLQQNLESALKSLGERSDDVELKQLNQVLQDCDTLKSRVVPTTENDVNSAYSLLQDIDIFSNAAKAHVQGEEYDHTAVLLSGENCTLRSRRDAIHNRGGSFQSGYLVGVASTVWLAAQGWNMLSNA